jgi:hypothetical protein
VQADALGRHARLEFEEREVDADDGDERQSSAARRPVATDMCRAGQ